MILSASRRTDIPAFYTEWFMNRIREGSVCVINPFNKNQISRVNITPEVVDCMVFWSKDPRPLMKHLDEIDALGYKYYFQFTITAYRRDVELNLNKKEIIKTFIELSEKIGKEKVILRYDPIFLTDNYSFDFHLKALDVLCDRLKDHTNKIVISFLDDYRKVASNMKGFNLQQLSERSMIEIAGALVEIASRYHLPMETCAEKIDLEELGINHAKCIDGELIEKIVKYPIKHKDKKDKNRDYCGCMKCIDIGQYDTCVHNCLYCYANVNKERARSNYKLHNPKSPVLFGDYNIDLVKDRKDVKSFRIAEEHFDKIKLFEDEA